MSAVPKLSAQTYLEQERRAESKSEYIDGEVFAMTGATRAHNLIAANILRELGNQLKRRPCEVYPGDMRVRVGNAYVYPDVSVVCGKPTFVDQDNLTNPTVIVEVLSPTTADYDQGGKFARYRRIPSLQDYLLVTQDAVSLVHYHRQDPNHWLLTELAALDATLELPAIGATLAVAEVYHKVFDAAP